MSYVTAIVDFWFADLFTLLQRPASVLFVIENVQVHFDFENVKDAELMQ